MNETRTAEKDAVRKDRYPTDASRRGFDQRQERFPYKQCRLPDPHSGHWHQHMGSMYDCKGVPL